MTIMAYKRVLLKLSGEALMGDDNYGINRAVIKRVVSEIAEVIRLNVEVAIVLDFPARRDTLHPVAPRHS